MKPEAFKAWREWMGWSQSRAAERLGVSKRTVQLYEKGRAARGQPVPLAIELACHSLSKGVRRYDGPSPEERPVDG